MTMRYSGTDERVEAVAGSVARRFAYDESQRTLAYLSPSFDGGAPLLPPEGSASLHWGPDGKGDTPAYGS